MLLYRFYEYGAALGAVFHSRSRLFNFIQSNLERHTHNLKSLPYVLNIEPAGNLCNLRCPLCPVGNFELKREKGMMKFETFKGIIDQLDESVFYIVFSGWGEPLANKEVFRMIRLARDRNIFCKLFTNATYLTEENIRNLLKSGVNVVRCSFDGLTEETYLKYRVGSNYAAVMQNFENLKRIKKEMNSGTMVEIQLVVMKHNYHEISEFKKLAKRLGFVPILKKAFITKTEHANWLPEDEKFRRYDKDVARRAELEAKEFSFCHAPWQNIFVLWTGEVTACCAKAQPAYIFGKSGQKSRDYWNGGLYQRISKGMQQDDRA